MAVQKKLTPLRKPRKSGGSPRGESEPPMLATRKMKKTADAPSDGEEGEEQDDEGQVVGQYDLEKFEKGRLIAEDDEAGDEEGHAPEDGDRAEVVLPEDGDGERGYGYGKQHADEGDDPPDGKSRAGEMRRPPGGQRRGGETEQKRAEGWQRCG